MDYLTAAGQRSGSFKEFMEEWIVDQFFRTLDEFGLKKPWYWDIFLDELEIYAQALRDILRHLDREAAPVPGGVFRGVSQQFHPPVGRQASSWLQFTFTAFV